MCIAIHSKGHLEILMLFEQNLISSQDKDIKFIECYDVILRNVGSVAIDKLYFLSPRSNGSDEYDFIDYQDTEDDFNWIFESFSKVKDKKVKDKDDRYSLTIDSSGEDESSFDVTMLYPLFQAPKWKKEDSKAHSLFTSCDKVYGAISFKNKKEIKPYDSSKPEETTYWIRIAFESKISFDQKLPVISFGPEDGQKIKIQPCVGMCRNSVLEVLRKDLLVFSSHDESTRELAIKVANQTWEIFNRPKTSTLIADYNICVLTQEDVIVLNPYFTGKCSYVGIKSTGEGKKSKIARMWYSGYNQFIEHNPVFMAREIHSYLERNATIPDHAKTAREIAALLSFDNLLNTLHVCESMVKYGFIEKTTDGTKISFYYVQDVYKELLYNDKETILANPALRELYIKFLDIVFSSKKNEDLGTENLESFYKADKFGIQYELVYS